MATSPPGSLVTPTVPPGWGRPVSPSQVRKQQMRDVAFRPGSSDRPVGKAGLLLGSYFRALTCFVPLASSPEGPS